MAHLAEIDEVYEVRGQTPCSPTVLPTVGLITPLCFRLVRCFPRASSLEICTRYTAYAVDAHSLCLASEREPSANVLVQDSVASSGHHRPFLLHVGLSSSQLARKRGQLVVARPRHGRRPSPWPSTLHNTQPTAPDMAQDPGLWAAIRAGAATQRWHS